MAPISDEFRECMYTLHSLNPRPHISPTVESIYIYFLTQAVADVEREIMKALEKQYMEILMPLRDGIPEKIEKQVQRLTRRQSIAPYVVPNQVDMRARY
jgi:hypothetical protein